MKPIPTLLLLVLLQWSTSCNDSPKTTDVSSAPADSLQIAREIDTVKNLVIQSFEGVWSDLDATKIKQYHTSDFMLLENGVVWTNDSIADYLSRERKVAAARQYQRLNRFEFHKAVHNQHSIWVAYDNYGTWVSGQDTLGMAHWLESAIAVKEQGKWKLEQLHSTAVRK